MSVGEERQPLKNVPLGQRSSAYLLSKQPKRVRYTPMKRPSAMSTPETVKKPSATMKNAGRRLRLAVRAGRGSVS